MNLWRIEDDRPRPLVAEGIDQERRLESILADDISILGLGPLMLLRRQVLTDHGARVDLLALDESGTVYVIELKRALDTSRGSSPGPGLRFLGPQPGRGQAGPHL